jgi:MscS family membrane protein
VIRKVYKLITGSGEDAAYILQKTKRPFTLLLITVGAELIFMIYSGLSEVAWVFKVFNIIYVLISVFLLYRLGNAIAVVKIEQIDLSKHVRNEVVNLGLKMMNILIGLIALIWVLKILGVNLTALLSGLGIGGIAVAFAAKDTIANFFGSVSILLGDLFEQGDWIAVDSMEGHVVEIGLRATTIRTFDNALIAIPNFKLADNGIKNWSRRLMGRRIKMIVGVTYESDMNDIKKALFEIKKMIKEHPHLMSDKTEFMSNERQLKLVSKEDLKGIKRTVMVNLDNFNSSSIDIMIYCFSRSVVWAEWYEIKEDVMFKVAEILKENHLEFAYPTMMIHKADEKADKDVDVTA